MAVSALAMTAMHEVIGSAKGEAEALVRREVMHNDADLVAKLALEAGCQENYGDIADHRYAMDLAFIGLLFEQELLRYKDLDAMDQIIMMLSAAMGMTTDRPVHRAQLQAMRLGQQAGELDFTHLALQSLVEMTPELVAKMGAPENVVRTAEGRRFLDLVFIGLLYEKDLL